MQDEDNLAGWLRDLAESLQPINGLAREYVVRTRAAEDDPLASDFLRLCDILQDAAVQLKRMHLIYLDGKPSSVAEREIAELPRWQP